MLVDAWEGGNRSTGQAAGFENFLIKVPELPEDGGCRISYPRDGPRVTSSEEGNHGASGRFTAQLVERWRCGSGRAFAAGASSDPRFPARRRSGETRAR